MLLGPIFWKEVKDEPKRKRLFQYLFAYAGLLSVVAIFCCLTGVEGGVARYDFGRIIFSFVCWSQLFIGCLLVPMMCAATVCDEKERNSLDILLLTLLSEREIVWSKFASRLLTIELFLSTSLPISGLVISMGGVTLGEMLVGQLYVACSICLAAACGMCCGTFFAKSYVAGFAGYGLFFVLCQLPGALPFLDLTYDYGTISALATLLHGAVAPDWRHGVSYSLGVSLLLLMIATRKLRAESVTRLWAFSARSLGQFTHWAEGKLPARLRASRAMAIAKSANPILWREMRGKSPRNNSALFIIYCFAGVGAVGLLAALVTLPLSAGAPFIYLGIVGTGLTVLATTSGALSFVREKESHSVDLLLLSPLEPEQIVQGKIVGIHRAIMPLLVSATVITVVYHLVWQIRNPNSEPVWLLADAAWFAMMYVLLQLYTVLGVQRSLESQSSVQAILHSLLRMGGIFIATSVLCSCFGGGALNPLTLASSLYFMMDSATGMRGAFGITLGFGTLVVGVVSWVIAYQVTTQTRARILAFYDRDITQDPEAWLWRDQALPRVNWRQKV